MKNVSTASLPVTAPSVGERPPFDSRPRAASEDARAAGDLPPVKPARPRALVVDDAPDVAERATKSRRR
jgi:hypothetical protein